MEQIFRDLRFAFRSLRRQPVFTAVVVATLALGIGVNVSMFQTLHGLLLRPLPLIETEGLMALGMQHATQSVEAFDFSPPDIRDFETRCSSCAGVAAFDRRTVVLTAAERARRIQGQAVSPQIFSLLGVDAARGRTLAIGEDGEEAPAVAVLSHRLWQQLGGGEELVGSDLLLDGRSTTVVGIMPPGFYFPERADLWFPLVMPRDDRRSQRWVDNVLVRLRPGVGQERASAEARAIGQQLATAHPDSNMGWSFTVMPFRERLVDQNTRQVLALLAGAVFLVLLIACVNVTNLLLARESGRSRGVAIRLALGSDRLSLIRQRMSENLLLSLVAGGLGLLVASWTVDLLAGADPAGQPAWMNLRLGPEGMVFTLALTIVCAFLFGWIPALRASRPDLGRSIGAARQGSGGDHRQQLQRSLVVTQVALALTLLVGASMVVRSVHSLLTLDPGFDTRHLLTLRVQLAGERAAEDARRIALFEEIEQRLVALPEIEAAAATSALPLAEDGTAVPLVHPDQVLRDGERQIVTYLLQTPGLFDVLDVPLLAGRRFTAEEFDDPERRVAIINDELASHLWGDRDPVGDRVRLGYEEEAPWHEVVGVVPKLYYEEPGEETDQSRLQVHLPYARTPWSTMALVLRTRIEPERAGEVVRHTLAGLDPNLAVDSIRTMEDLRTQVTWGERLQGQLFSIFALLALALAALGVYGVMAHLVSLRRTEIGVRMALGADRRSIARLFLGRGLALLAPGTLIGLAGGTVAAQLLAGVLYGVEPLDFPSFLAAALLLVLGAGIGVWLPARRATRVEPVVALRQE